MRLNGSNVTFRLTGEFLFTVEMRCVCFFWCELYVYLSQLGWVCNVPLRALWLRIVRNSINEVWALSSFIREMVLFDVRTIGTASTLLFLRRHVRFVFGAVELVGLVADEALLDWMVCVCAQTARQSVCMLFWERFVCKDRWCVISVCRGVAPHTGSTKPTLFTVKSQHPIIRRDPLSHGATN